MSYGLSKGLHNQLVHLTRKNGGLNSLKVLGISLFIRRAGDHRVIRERT